MGKLSCIAMFNLVVVAFLVLLNMPLTSIPWLAFPNLIVAGFIFVVDSMED